MRRFIGGRTIAIGALALLAAALLAPGQSALAFHETICANAIASGTYNVIVGSGRIVGTSGNDVIIGSAGPDDISAGSGNDVICGRGGDDKIDGGSGNDDLIGDVGDVDPGPGGVFGDGDDVVVLDPAVYGPTGTPGADDIRGGSGSDRLWGDGTGDALDGGSGSDQFFGGAGNDALDGGSGNDVFNGGPDADDCRGGSGSDSHFMGTNSCETVDSIP